MSEIAGESTGFNAAVAFFDAQEKAESGGQPNADGKPAASDTSGDAAAEGKTTQQVEPEPETQAGNEPEEQPVNEDEPGTSDEQTPRKQVPLEALQEERRKRQELARKVESLEAYLARQQSQPPPVQPPPVQPPPQTPQQPQYSKPEPVLDDFDTVAEYTKAVVRHEKEREAWEQQQEMQQRQAQRQQNEFQAFVGGKLAEARQSSEFVELVEGNSSLRMSDSLAIAAMNSEQWVEVAVWLGKNPDECARLSQLPWPQQIKAIGRIEERIAFAKADPSKKEIKKEPTKVMKPGTGPDRREATGVRKLMSQAKTLDDWAKVVEAAGI